MISHLCIALIRLYRWTLSPLKQVLFGPAAKCRFTPSCSLYAIEALQKHGWLRGGWLSIRRLSTCHPWGNCGHDPVPGHGPAKHHHGNFSWTAKP